MHLFLSSCPTINPTISTQLTIYINIYLHLYMFRQNTARSWLLRSNSSLWKKSLRSLNTRATTQKAHSVFNTSVHLSAADLGWEGEEPEGCGWEVRHNILQRHSSSVTTAAGVHEDVNWFTDCVLFSISSTVCLTLPLLRILWSPERGGSAAAGGSGLRGAGRRRSQADWGKLFVHVLTEARETPFLYLFFFLPKLYTFV